MRIKTDLPLTLSKIAKILDTRLPFDSEINAITTDSRLCETNDLFIALPGERYDGKAFIQEAREKRAFVIAESPKADLNVQCSHKALLAIASAYKELIFPKHTVAVTGSVGKTTVKDFIHTLLCSTKSHKTDGNFNNIIGLSYTLLSMPQETEYLICEIGMNHLGEIDVLSRALRPNVSVITNVGTAHIGNIGSREKIAQAKLEIQNGMNDGKTIIFDDEPLLHNAKNAYKISYTNPCSDMFVKTLYRSSNGSRFTVKTKNFEKDFKTSLSSAHTLNSLILSIAVCDILNVSPNTISEQLSLITEKNLRQRFITKNGYTIYNDSYNSSPEAVIADLRMLSEKGSENIAVLGDMLELGEESEALHKSIGAACVRYNVKKLYAFGKYSKYIADGAISSGMDKDCVYINQDIDRPDLTALQISESYRGETILLKASHSVKIDRIKDLLIKETEK